LHQEKATSDSLREELRREKAASDSLREELRQLEHEKDEMELWAVLLKHETEERAIDIRRLGREVHDTLYRTWRHNPTLGVAFTDAEEFRQRYARERAESQEEFRQSLARKRAEHAAQQGAEFVRRMQVREGCWQSK
jgi:hypothetical protein